MIYTEPFVVTGGGPGNSTTFLSIDLVKMARRPVRPRPGRGHVDHLLPDHPAAVMGVLHRHDLRATQRREGGNDMASNASQLALGSSRRSTSCS